METPKLDQTDQFIKNQITQSLAFTMQVVTFSSVFYNEIKKDPGWLDIFLNGWEKGFDKEITQIAGDNLGNDSKELIKLMVEMVKLEMKTVIYQMMKNIEIKSFAERGIDEPRTA